MQVAIIDDQKEIALYLRYYVEDLGYNGSIVVPITEYATFNWWNIDVVIVDLMLGLDITGQDVINFLRLNYPHLGIVAISANTLMLNEVEGAHYKLAKPFESHELREAIDNAPG